MARAGARSFTIVAVACGLSVGFGLGPIARAQEKVGVDSAVNPRAEGTPPSAPTRRLELGQDVIHNERIVTAADGQTQVLFLDASAMTIGPSSDVTIDDFLYDPHADTGKLAMSMSKGLMRFVGGKVSKLENAVTVETPAATLGIRGGVFLLKVSPTGLVEVIFLYGKMLMVTARYQTEIITHPGWSVTVSGLGATPSKAAPASAAEIASLLNLLSGRVGLAGGARSAPTEFLVGRSGVPGIISGNLASSTQQAIQNSPQKTQPQVIDIGGLTTLFELNDVSMQPVVAAIIEGPGSPSSNAITPINPPSPISPPTNPSPPIAPPTVNFPTTGVGSFTGTASGIVVNNGNTFQATGGFNQIYNFGSQSGVANITNFDGANYGFGVTGSGAQFSGSLASGPANHSGTISGAFSGSGATQTNGSFGVQSIAGPTHTISGTFSGR